MFQSDVTPWVLKYINSATCKKVHFYTFIYLECMCCFYQIIRCDKWFQRFCHKNRVCHLRTTRYKFEQVPSLTSHVSGQTFFSTSREDETWTSIFISHFITVCYKNQSLYFLISGQRGTVVSPSDLWQCCNCLGKAIYLHFLSTPVCKMGTWL